MSGPGEGRGSGRSCFGSVVSVLLMLFSAFWLLNFSCGLVEIPDNLPLFGNLDEAFFSALLLACLRYLGFDPLKLAGRGRGDAAARAESKPNGDA